MNKTVQVGSTIGVLIPAAPVRNAPRTTSYSHYVHEILGHAGLCYALVEEQNLLESLPELRMLVTVGEADWSEEIKSGLQTWVENGGSWLSLGGTGGMPGIFGVEYRAPKYLGGGWGGQSRTLGEGYLEVSQASHPLMAGVPLPLHFFNGTSVTLKAGEEGVSLLAKVLTSHQHASPCAAVVERNVGLGRTLLIGPDAVGSVVRIQQGVSVTRDGMPADDGTGTVSDGVLKCDDGLVLDWHFDRQEVANAPGLCCFLEPVADHWRDLILRSIFHLARECEIPLFLLWLYPRNLPALGHLSHDSDGNIPEHARTLLKVLARAEVQSTWCIIMPGYDQDIIKALKEQGQDLATHYDAMDYSWSEANFDSQWRGLCEQFGERPVGNKNHFTRWEGDTEFFDWCAKRGIEIDGSKGPSKFGEAGFTFGTCHPYFPFSPQGEILNVLEVPFLSQDLVRFVTAAVVEPFLSATLKVHGIMHLLFHPSSIDQEEIANALLDAVRVGKEAGLEWWTARQINAWERARRQVTWNLNAGDGVSLSSVEVLPDATLLVYNPRSTQLVVDGAVQPLQTTSRWGFEFTTATLNLSAGTQYCLQLSGA